MGARSDRGRVKVEVVVSEPGEVVGTCGPVVVRIVDGGSTETEHMDRLGTVIDTVLARSPIVGMWVVVCHGSPPPSMEAARRGKQLFGSHGERLAVVYSMLGIGFWAAASRQAAAVLNRIIGTPSPIEASVEAGAERMAFELVGLDPAELCAGYEQLAAHLVKPGATSGQGRAAGSR